MFLTACTSMRYSYYPSNYRNDKISISAKLIDHYDENSPVDYISVSDRRSSVTTPHNIQILSPSIKIVSNDKEYNITTNKSAIFVFKQGVTIIDDFTAHIGKVQLDTGEIIDIPPLHFKKHIYVRKYNGFMDALGKSMSKDIFQGTVEEYKKNGWKEE